MIIEPPLFRITGRKTSISSISPTPREFRDKVPRHRLHRAPEFQPHVPSFDDYLIRWRAISPKVEAVVEDVGQEADNNGQRSNNRRDADDDDGEDHSKFPIAEAEAPAGGHARLD